MLVPPPPFHNQPLGAGLCQVLTPKHLHTEVKGRSCKSEKSERGGREERGQEKENRLKETDGLTQGARDTHTEKEMSERDTEMERGRGREKKCGGRR